MNVRELYDALNAKIPPSLSCEWDNDGLMCCPDPDREVIRVLIALDLTGEVADEAVDGDFDAVVTHHPLIFHPLRSLTPDDGTGAKLINLVRSGITVMSFHTRLDALPDGVNDVLSDALGLTDAQPLTGEGGVVGRIGSLAAPAELGEFAQRVKAALAAPCVTVSGCGRLVSRVALMGGKGDDLVAAARAAGADTYVSGELGYHIMNTAEETGINLIEAGHFYTEDPVCDRLAEFIVSADAGIETVYKKSCAVRVC